MYTAQNGMTIPTGIDYPQCYAAAQSAAAGLQAAAAASHHHHGAGWPSPGQACPPPWPLPPMMGLTWPADMPMYTSQSLSTVGEAASAHSAWQSAAGLGHHSSSGWQPGLPGYPPMYRNRHCSESVAGSDADIRLRQYHHSFNDLPDWQSFRQANFGVSAYGSTAGSNPYKKIKQEHSSENSYATHQLVPVPPSLQPFPKMNIAESFIALELRLCDEMRSIELPSPITHVYSPLEYAMDPHRQFVHTYCSSFKDVLFLGMNPGPFGMAQTGVNS